jgi:mRNA-degrading endonuclease toxin of MazEF toxin-antitoxin module
LSKDSVVKVSAPATVNKSELWQRVGLLPFDLMSDIDRGLRLVIGL